MLKWVSVPSHNTPCRCYQFNFLTTRYILSGGMAEGRTTVSLKKGQELYDHYVSPLSSTRGRRTRLKEGWYFDCDCERCADPTELGTNFSSAFCGRCTTKSIVLPSDPLLSELEHQRTCQSCKSVDDRNLSHIEDQLETVL